MLNELFISPGDLDVIQLLPNRTGSLGNSIKKGITALEGGEVNLAIIGIPESRGSACEDFSESPDLIRSLLYGLCDIDPAFNICDLGNVKSGKTLNDTYAAIKVIVEELVGRNISILVIGGSQDLTIPLADGFVKEPGNLLIIDDRLDYSEDLDFIKDEQFINYINPISKINLLAAQSFFINNDAVKKAIHNRSGEIVLLGELREDIRECEPLVRSCDLISFDMSALKANEASGQYRNSPNGLYGEEACQLAWYAGLSHKRNIFSFFGYSPSHDPTSNGAMVAAQIAWYYIKGVANRKIDSPSGSYSEFRHYHVPIEDTDHTILFLKHTSTERWWMEIPFFTEGEEKTKFIPCTEKDYLTACGNEIPDRWLKGIVTIAGGD